MRDGKEYCYTGEVDQEDKLCGYGAGHWKKHPTIKSEGTYFDNKSHGISESISLQKMACFLFALQAYVFLSFEELSARSNTDRDLVNQHFTEESTFRNLFC